MDIFSVTSVLVHIMSIYNCDVKIYNPPKMVCSHTFYCVCVCVDVKGISNCYWCKGLFMVMMEGQDEI